MTCNPGINWILCWLSADCIQIAHRLNKDCTCIARCLHAVCTQSHGLHGDCTRIAPGVVESTFIVRGLRVELWIACGLHANCAWSRVLHVDCTRIARGVVDYTWIARGLHEESWIARWLYAECAWSRGLHVDNGWLYADCTRSRGLHVDSTRIARGVVDCTLISGTKQTWRSCISFFLIISTLFTNFTVDFNLYNSKFTQINKFINK